MTTNEPVTFFSEDQLKLRWSRFELAGVAACSAVVVSLIAMAILRVFALHSSFYDLGQYTTYHHAIAFDGDWSLLFRTHAHLLAVPYALIYRLLPGGLTLVLLQAAMMMLGAALYVAYWRRLRLPSPVAGALLYLASLPVWYNTLFDFHFEHLIFPLIIGFFLLLERPASTSTKVLAVIAGLLLCGVKEVYALSGAMLGLYLLLAKRWFVTGAVLTILSLCYFFVATQIAIPHFSGGAGTGEMWQSGFGYLGVTTSEIAANIARRPWIIVQEVFGTPRKLLYIGILLGTLAFLPVFRPLMLLPSLPVLGISLLSHNVTHYYIGHQYTAMVTATFLVAAASALSSWQVKKQNRWICVMLAATVAGQVLFGPSPVSRLFWSPNVFNYHWSAYRLDEHDRKLEAAVNAMIPVDDRLAVSMQNAINTDLLSDRSFAFAYPDGVFAPAEVFFAPPSQFHSDREIRKSGQSKFADFVVLDRRRPLSFGDEICVYRRDNPCQDETFVSRFDEAIVRLSKDFTVLYDDDGILIARRR